jgi:hypothetical protein
MTENTRFQSKRSRTILGLVVVALSFGLPVAFAGVSFAQNSSTSAAQYQYGKITICHHTHSKKHPSHTITVSQNAWKAHKKHGDTLGPCPAPELGKAKGDVKGKDNAKGKDEGKGKADDNDKGKTADTGTTAGDKAKTGDAGTTTGDQAKPGNNGNGNGNGNAGDKGKPADTPGNGNTGNNGNGKGKGK